MKIINIQNLYRERKAFLRQVTVAESEIPWKLWRSGANNRQLGNPSLRDHDTVSQPFSDTLR
jgi:hypothetical protein